MRRRRFRKPAVKLALFPFLAVLVCTMGALIVLLVLMVQQARVYATVQTATKEQKPTLELELDREALALEEEEYLWRREILEQQRVEMTQKLAASRLQLSHLEDHIRRLEARWSQLEAAARKLEELEAATSTQRDQSAEELAEVQQALEMARQRLEEARAEAAARPRSFAIVPYDGPHGTQRRPIYVECTAEGIILQPENVVLRAADFRGPLGPGNPLDAALRAIREHLNRLQVEAGEPYPLLVVRPDGVVAYNVARQAIAAWDDEFGYELIDADLQLAYPPADPYLKGLIEASVRDARQRQAILAAAMPSQFEKSQFEGFVASSRGGFVPLGGSGRPGRGIGTGGGFTSDPSPGEGRYSDRTQFQSRDSESRDSESRGAETETAGEEETAQSAGGNGGTQQEAQSAGGASFSLARKRGNNWANPEALSSATAVTRPIGVACDADRVSLLPEAGIRAYPVVIPMPQGPAPAIDPFVRAVREHMDKWGLSFPGGYWKPVLQCYVSPGAERQFEALQRLLDNSGFDVQRMTP